MYNRLAFILPRAAGFTLAAGAAALILFVLFKVLLFVLAVTLVFVAAKGIAGFFRHNRYDRYEEYTSSVQADIIPVDGRNTPIVPVIIRNKQQTIIPIS